MNPLWIISLFLGLTEVVIGLSLTQADGWVQGMLATFCVALPVAVGACFVTILWRRPWLLYAPRDFPEAPTLPDFRQWTDGSNAARISTISLENVDHAIQAAIEGSTAAESDAEVQDLVAAATAAYRRQTVTVDLQDAFPEKANMDPLVVPVSETTSVSDFLGTIWWALERRVPPFTYTTTWVLETPASDTRHDQIGTLVAKSAMKSRSDLRTLPDVGIHPGDHLRVKIL